MKETIAPIFTDPALRGQARSRLARLLQESGVNSTQRLVAEFIFARTVVFRKQWEIIPCRHITGGVWSKDGELVTYGVDVATGTVRKAVDLLRAMEIITSRERPDRPIKDGYGLEYKINLQNVMPLAKPKRIKEQSDQPGHTGENGESHPLTSCEQTVYPTRSRPPTPHVVDPLPTGGDSIKSNINVNKTDRNVVKRPASRPQACKAGKQRGTSLADARQRAVVVHQAALLRRASLLDKKRLTMPDLSKMWSHEVATRFSKPMPLTAKEKGALHGKQKAFLSLDEGTFGHFTAWVLDNWSALIHMNYGWMTNGPSPDQPDVWFFITRHTDFVAHFRKRTNQAWLFASQGYDEGDELCQRLAIGQGYDEAILAIADRRRDEKRGEKLTQLAQELRATERRISSMSGEQRRREATVAKQAMDDYNNRIDLDDE